MGLPRGENLKLFMLGECTVIVTCIDGVNHLSIAHERRYPTWDEIAEARYRCLPDGIHMAMWLPPRDQYVAIHPNCFQLVESIPPYGRTSDVPVRQQGVPDGEPRPQA